MRKWRGRVIKRDVVREGSRVMINESKHIKREERKSYMVRGT